MALLRAAQPDLNVETVAIVTRGDRVLDKPLPAIGGKGLFTAELEQQLLDGDIDCAVHSLKDLPVDQPAGLKLGALLDRADVRDVWIARDGAAVADLPAGARVGTSSLRRRAQLLALRPDLVVDSIRGNVETRIRKCIDGQYDAIILAGAGVLRLGLQRYITAWLPLDAMLPAPGQAVLAVQSRQDDQAVDALLRLIHDPLAAACATAERAFLDKLGGGCSLPVGAHATVSGETLQVTGRVAAVNGDRAITVTGDGRVTEAEAIGHALAASALAQGAGTLLGEVTP